MPRPRREGRFLNAKIAPDIFALVEQYSEETRIPKTAIVEMALKEFFQKNMMPSKMKKDR